MADRLQILTEKYREYVATFRDEKGNLPAMMQLKLDHTNRVVANAVAIADGENFSREEKIVCEAAALLHDTGRYEQLKKYNTFRDSESVDHAIFSHDIVANSDWLRDWENRDAILTAVLVHNRREIDRDKMDALTLCASRTVRDADKLDIFRVLEEQIATCDWRRDRQAFWNLSTTAKPNEKVIAGVRDNLAVDYQEIKSLADFVLIQVGWIRGGLEFATSRKICRDREHMKFRREFLRELDAGDEALALCEES